MLYFTHGINGSKILLTKKFGCCSRQNDPNTALSSKTYCSVLLNEYIS